MSNVLLDIWAIFDSLSFRVALSFQWVLSHARLSGNKLADSLAKTEQHSTFAHVSSPLAPVIAKIRYIRCNEINNLFDRLIRLYSTYKSG